MEFALDDVMTLLYPERQLILVVGDGDVQVRRTKPGDVDCKRPRKLERAAAFEDAARALCQEGRGEEAITLLDEALEAYERASAAVDEARALALLRCLGVRRGRRARRNRPVIGWDSLTSSELRVAGLVAEGHANPAIAAKLYVSRHTVETHLRHILAKLGASSRVEVAAQAARGGPTSTT